MCCATQKLSMDSCGCGCIGRSEYTPRFMTSDQKVARLEQYLAGLQEEAKAVETHIAQMKQES